MDDGFHERMGLDDVDHDGLQQQQQQQQQQEEDVVDIDDNVDMEGGPDMQGLAAADADADGDDNDDGAAVDMITVRQACDACCVMFDV